MKSLALYIDKWYIVGAVCTDGITRPVNLPNGEDRIWLYFYEDVANNEVSYSKGFQSKYRNNEPHYYGDVFSLITQSAAKYIMFKRPQDMKGIFKSAKIFDDLRKDMEAKEDDVISTYISFSKDVSLASRFLFIEELKKEKFEICESVARIDHLSLEYATKKSQYIEDGYYLVLNACNENLHYSLYKKDEDLFTRIEEEVLNGMGTDVRSRALIEHVVDNINQRENFLKTDSERESEYLRMAQYVDNWLVKLSNARNMIPVQLTDITLSRDPYKDYSMQVKKGKIDERTDKIVSDIINVLTRFVNDLKVSHEQVKGILFLGNTFTNAQFKKDLNKHYNLDANKMVVYQDFEISSLVSAYTFIDCSQFIATKNEIRGNAEAELRRIQIAEQEANAKRLAKEEAEARALKDKESSDAERKFKDAMEMGYDAENKHDYDKMEEFFKIALTLHPDNEEARQRHEDALRKKAEHTVQLSNYKEKIQQAKEAYKKGDYETASQKAEESLSFMRDSKEALRIKEDSIRRLKSQKELERYLVRADLFIAQKAYSEAKEELRKARLLDVDDKEIVEREKRIKDELNTINLKITELVNRLNSALDDSRFEDALSICNELIDIDFTNSRKWNMRISEIINELKEELHKAVSQQQFEKAIELCSKLTRIDSSNSDNWLSQKQNIQNELDSQRKIQRELDELRKEIENKHLNQEWIELKSLCEKYLKNQDDNHIRELSAKAQEQIILEEIQQEFDCAYDDNNWQLILTLSKEYPILKRTPANNRVINEAMRKNRKKIDDLKGREKSRLPIRKSSNAPLSSLPEPDVKIEINKPSKPHVKKIIRKNNISKTDDVDELKNDSSTVDEKKLKDTNNNITKRKFPKVKRNK